LRYSLKHLSGYTSLHPL